jgi:twitching motility protein PilT
MSANNNQTVNRLLLVSAKRKALTIHLTVGAYPTLRIDDELVELGDEAVVTDNFVRELAASWLTEPEKEKLEREKEITLVKNIEDKLRVKTNFFFQKNFLSAKLSIIPEIVPALVNLGLPKSTYNLVEKKSGLIVIGGPYGSGRTTTVSALLEEINKSQKANILTLEKPIEYLLVNKKSLIEQRQVGSDVNSYLAGLKLAAQADVDVMAVAEAPDQSSMLSILEFANSGRLVILIMTVPSAIEAIETILAGFDLDAQARIQTLLAGSLQAIIIQRLVPRVGSGLSLASEVLLGTEPVRSLIREGKIKQISTILQTSRSEGMISLEQSLAQLIKSGEVLIDRAAEYANDQNSLKALIRK